MGGYRSLKRVLGESNLERKFRWLFGLSIGTLIVLAFGGVWFITYKLIRDTADLQGHDLVRVALFNLHWQHWNTKEDRESEQTRQLMAQELVQDTLDLTILKLDQDPVPTLQGTRVIRPNNAFELELLARLKSEAEREFSRPRGANEIVEPVSDSHPAREQGKYYYYEVVHWSASCKSCHEALHGAFAESAAASHGGVFDPNTRPFRAVRVTMRYDQTATAISFTTAVLITVGFITVFLSMVAFYFVVRYVVIKPLTHLRDVSDEVARGDLALRADIHTGDEFEDLAESFNKMLRHLIEAQAELRGANDELDQKVDELARLNMQLHEMNRMRGEFLANMSHELRTPLNSIIGFAEVLQGLEALNEKQKKYAQNIQKSGRNLLDMINDILDLAKMEAGKMEVRLSEFRIDRIIHEQCDLVRDLAEDKNIALKIEIENDLPLLYQDQTKVQQILTNLLSNAIKFTPEGGRITVGAQGDPRGRIEFWVEDTGVGIPASEKEVIFEKFRQGTAVLGRDNLTREYSGTGLGLSIVKELCKLLGGEVSVESELGKGSTFRVVIPWMRTEQAAAATKLNAKLDEIARPRPVEPRRAETVADSNPVGAATVPGS
jgi:two-component system, NarL family, sensor histidine kinase BarA